MNKLILNSVSYVVEIDTTSDETCPKCALNDLLGGCSAPCEVFDHHMKGTTDGNCYFIKEGEKTEETKEVINNKKIEVAKELYDVLGSLESCFDECPLMEVCNSSNTICDKLKGIAKC